MAKRGIRKGIIRDIVIVVIGILAIWIGLQVVFGTPNPFYVVASGSMIPALEVYDVLMVQGHVKFEDIKVGDIIVFNRPSDHERVIVHRVAAITNDDPRTIRTIGDANYASIPGTDFPIMEKDYIGKVEHVIPQIGYITQILKPPVNYIIIAIIVGIMIIKQITRRRDDDDEGKPVLPTTTTTNGDDIYKSVLPTTTNVTATKDDYNNKEKSESVDTGSDKEKKKTHTQVIQEAIKKSKRHIENIAVFMHNTNNCFLSTTITKKYPSRL